MTSRLLKLVVAVALVTVAATAAFAVAGSAAGGPGAGSTSAPSASATTVKVLGRGDIVNQGHGAAITIKYSCQPGIPQGKGGGNFATMTVDEPPSAFGFQRFTPTCDGSMQTASIVVPVAEGSFSAGKATVHIDIIGLNAGSAQRDVELR